MSAPAPSHRPVRPVTALLRTVRAALAADVAAFLLAGLPYGLIRYIGWPLPHHLPSLTAIRTDLTSPILGDQVYLNALAIVIWLLWLLIAVSFALETLALLRGTEIPPLPGLRPTQALAAVLLTAIGITALTARAAAPAQAATTNTPVPARPPAPSTAPLRPGADQQAGTTADATTVTGSAPSPAHPAETEHTVVAGDNLFDIARADYGNGNDWTVLYAYNTGATQPDGQKLTNPDLIRPGWVLHTTDPAAQPAPAPATAPRSAATPGPNHTAPNTGAPTSPAHTAPTPGSAPTRTELRGQHSNSPVRRPSSAAPSASSGWVNLAEGGALAAGVLAALGLALRRARRLRRWYGTCYWPTPGQQPTEPLTVPVPLRPAPQHTATAADQIDQIDQAELDQFGAPIDPSAGLVEDHAPARPAAFEQTARQDSPPQTGPGADAGADLGDSQDEQGPARIAVAAAGGRILALQDLDAALALSGPGALPAARAVAAAVLSAAWHRHDGARLLICRQDAALLLDCAEADLPAGLENVPDLELAAHGTKALAQLEQEVAYRTRLLEEHEVTALEETPDYDEDYFPPIVLLAVSRPEHAARVSATLQAGASLRAHAILLGEFPGSQAWHVDADGHLAGPGAPAGARMFHLSAQGLSATLALLADAAGDALREQRPPLAPDPRGELAAPPTDPDTVLAADDAAQPLNGPETAAGAAAPARTDSGGKAPQPKPEAGEHGRGADAAGRAVPEPVAVSAMSTAAPAAHADRESPVEHDAAGRDSTEAGPRLLTASAGPDRAAQIIEQHATRPVRIKVLGVRSITTPTGTIDARLRGDAWRAAMKLAVAGRRGQHLDDFAALWPDHDDQLLRKTVKNAVYDLRRTLKQRCQDPANHPGRYITQADHRYVLSEQTVGVDLAAFTALRTLAASTRDPGERAAAAEAALALYDGDLLTGMDEEWVIAPRARARRDALATATLLAQLADQAGDAERALSWWERALQIDDNEEVYRQIITLQMRMGRHADAAATRDLLIARLNADDLAPAAATLDVLARLHERRPAPGETRSPHRRAA